MATIARAWRIDSDGFFLEDLIDLDPHAPGVLFTETPLPEGLTFPRFHAGQWVNGDAVVEIIDRAWGVTSEGFFTEDLADYDTAKEGQTFFTRVPYPNGTFVRPRFDFLTRTWVEGHIANLAAELETARAAKRNQVLQWRTQALAAGFEFNFAGTIDRVQTRYERDMINIQGVFSDALAMQLSGDVAPLFFRGESNTTHPLTPAEAIALGRAAKATSELIYAQSWQLIDAIDQAESITDIHTITLPA